MKSTKTMQLKSNAELKKGASQTFAVVNSTPTYLFRKMNKLAEGKDADFNEIAKEGISKEDVCEQYNRLQEAASCGGYWWGSVIARHGYIITAARKVEFAEGDENGTDVKPLYVAKGEELLTEVINGTLYTLKAASAWNYANIIASAALFMKFKEERARQCGNLYSWQQAQDTAKAQAKEARDAEAKARKEARKAEAKARKEARKAEAKKAKEVAKAIQDFQVQVKAGTMSNEEAANKLAEILAA